MKKLAMLLVSLATVLSIALSGVANAASTFAKIDGTADGNLTDVVAATASKTNKVRELMLVANVAEVVTVKCGATAKLLHLAPANTPVVYKFGSGQFECAVNEAVNIDKTTNTTDVVGYIIYDVQ